MTASLTYKGGFHHLIKAIFPHYFFEGVKNLLSRKFCFSSVLQDKEETRHQNLLFACDSAALKPKGFWNKLGTTLF